MKKLYMYILIFIAIIITLVVASYMYLKSKSNKINFIEVSSNKVRLNEGVGYNIQEYYNIVLIGLNSNDNYNTDAIIISIDNKNKKINLVGLNLYTFLKVEDESFERINKEYLYKNSLLIINTLNKNLDLNINKLIAFDFEAIQTIVDIFGGIELEINDNEAKYIEGIEKCGIYNLTGEQVISYINIKNEFDNQYKRNERMMTVITELFLTSKKIYLSNFRKIADEVFPKIYTNINGIDFITIIFNIMSYSVEKNIQFTNEIKAITLGEETCEFPKDLSNDVINLYEDLFNISDHQPSDTVINISTMF